MSSYIMTGDEGKDIYSHCALCNRTFMGYQFARTFASSFRSFRGRPWSSCWVVHIWNSCFPTVWCTSRSSRLSVPFSVCGNANNPLVVQWQIVTNTLVKFSSSFAPAIRGVRAENDPSLLTMTNSFEICSSTCFAFARGFISA